LRFAGDLTTASLASYLPEPDYSPAPVLVYRSTSSTALLANAGGGRAGPMVTKAESLTEDSAEPLEKRSDSLYPLK
jgi:hypothetical protein